MTDDNLNGAQLSVLECRALLDYIEALEYISDGLPASTTALCKASEKIKAGAARELPSETRERNTGPKWGRGYE